jgi:hypothetical protein
VLVDQSRRLHPPHRYSSRILDAFDDADETREDDPEDPDGGPELVCARV